MISDAVLCSGRLSPTMLESSAALGVDKRSVCLVCVVAISATSPVDRLSVEASRAGAVEISSPDPPNSTSEMSEDWTLIALELGVAESSNSSVVTVVETPAKKGLSVSGKKSTVSSTVFELVLATAGKEVKGTLTAVDNRVAVDLISATASVASISRLKSSSKISSVVIRKSSVSLRSMLVILERVTMETVVMPSSLDVGDSLVDVAESVVVVSSKNSSVVGSPSISSEPLSSSSAVMVTGVGVVVITEGELVDKLVVMVTISS